MSWLRMSRFFSLIFYLLIFTCAGFASPWNINLLQSPENQTGELQLLEIPLQLVEPGDTVIIAWNPPDESGILWYGLNPGEGDTVNYPNRYEDPYGTLGYMEFDPVILPVGLLFCMISTPSGATSIEFSIVRESPSAVTMIYPQSDVNSVSGVPSTTPVFQWNPNPGVPYYHIILSDQPFDVETDPVTGEVTTTGANIIWQVITSGTSIEYGSPDPSNFFSNTNVPPLVGDTTGLTRPTYNWVALNNYGNQPAFTSEVVSDLMGFEIYTIPPFEPPQLLAPDSGAVITDETILFQWAGVPLAVSYHFYLTKLEVSPDSSTVYVPVYGTQTTVSSVELLAGNLLTNGIYRWKVIAVDDQGEGSISFPFDFNYAIDAARVNFYVHDSLYNQPVQGAQIEFLPLEGPNIPDIATDENGFSWRDVPYGVYLLEVSKPGFTTTIAGTLTVDSPSVPTQYLIIPQAPSTAFGTVVDDNSQPVPFADVEATNVFTGQTVNGQSNNNGCFSLSFAPGSWSFVASKTGYTSSPPLTVSIVDSLFNLDEHGGPLIVTLNLYSLDGYVLNPEGEPISLATVGCTNGVEDYEYVTGENGYYDISVAPDVWTLTAEKPVFWLSTTLEPIQVINSGFTNNIELTPAANVVSGVVFEGAVLSSGNALVRAVPGSGPITETYVTDQGDFVLSLPSGNYELNAYLEGFSSPPPVYLSLSVGGTISGINIVLTPNPSYITGRVTSDGVQAVPQAVVNSGSVADTTDIQGNYTLNVPPGPHIVSASKYGFTTASSPPLNMGFGQTLSNINLTIYPNAATVNGAVRSNGQPVYLAQVTARKVSTGVASMVQTQEDGSYTFGLTFGDYWIKASKTGFASSPPESIQVNISPGQALNDVDFEFIPNVGIISGSTLYNGMGVSNTQLELTALDDPSLAFSTQSNFYGDFDLAVDAGHAYEITASKTGYVSASATSDTVYLNSSQQITLEMIQLQSQLKGKVYALPDSTYIYDAVVTAELEGGGQFSTQTNSLGSYTLDLNPGSIEVTASKAGYVSAAGDTSINPGQTIQNYHFHLNPNLANLQGIVRGAGDQTPIQNTLVSVTEINTQNGGSTYSGDDGFYSFDGLFQGSYDITVTHPQYQTALLNGIVLLGGSTTGQDVSMSSLSCSISGVVFDSDTLGAGISGATVNAEKANGDIYTTQTVPGGVYSLPSLASGFYTLSASKEGYSIDTTSVQLTANTHDTIDFVLLPNDGKIVGLVIDNEKNGLGNVQLSAQDSLGHFGNAVTASSGDFILEDLNSQSTFIITVIKPGYHIQPPDTVIRVVPEPVPSDTISITMYQNYLSISGTVTNQNGDPLGGIEVKAAAGSITLIDETNSNGEYIIESVAPLTNYTVSTNSYAFHYDDTSRSVSVDTIPLFGVNLVMIEHSASIEGNVGIPNIQMKARKVGGSVYSTLSVMNGSYTIPYLYESDYKIYPSIFGYTSAPDTIDISLSFGETLVGIDFTLTQYNIDISGFVYEVFDSTVIPNVEIVAWSSVSTDTTTSNDDGSFLLTGMTPGINHEISTLLPDSLYDNGLYSLIAGDSSVTDIELHAAAHDASVGGWVLELNGAGLSEVTITLRDIETIITTDSSYLFNFLYPRDDYSICFSRAGYADYDTVFNLGLSQTLDLGVIDLIPLSSAVFGTVADGFTGEGLGNASVTISSVSGAFTQSLVTGFHGLYYFENLDDDTYRLTVSRKGFTTVQSADFTVESGSSEELNFTLTPFPNSIYGTVVDTCGNPLPGAEVSADKFGASVHLDTADELGNYSFALTPGNYQLHAVHDSLDSFYENAVLYSGGRVELDLTVLRTAGVYVIISADIAPPRLANATLQNTVNFNLFTEQNAPFDSVIVFSGLREVPYSAAAFMPGCEALNSPVIIYPELSQTDTVQFVMIPLENAVFGRVMDASDGLPLPGATVYLNQTGEPDTLTSQSGGLGGFAFPDLPDGDFTLWVEKNGCLQNDSSRVTFTLENNTPVNEFLWLTTVSQAISGTAIDIVYNRPLPGAVIHLTGVDVSIDTTDTTGSEGTYLFTDLVDGTYAVKAYDYLVQPDSHLVTISSGAPVFGKDFFFTPAADSFEIDGVVSYGIDSLIADARVTIRSLLSIGKKDTTFTGSNGYYSFTDWQGPDEIILKVTKYGFPALTSGTIELASDTTRDFSYPSGQLKFLVTFDGDSAAGGVNINVYNSANNIDTLLMTDDNGTAQTTPLLEGNDYQITVTHFLPDVLPLESYTVALDDYSTVEDSIILGVDYVCDDSSSVNIDVQVEANVAEVLIPGTPEDFLISLFYKGVASTAYQEITMSPVITLSSADPGASDNDPFSIASPILSGQGANPAGKRGTILMESDGGSAPPENLTTANNPAGENSIKFTATIPGQTGSGRVRYYIRAGSGDRVWSNQSQPDSIVITSDGVLATLQLSPSNTSLQWPYEQSFSIGAFDDALNPLNDQLDDIVWTHWKAENPADSLGSLIIVSTGSSALFWSADTGLEKIRVNVFKDNVTLSATANLNIEYRELQSLDLVGNITGASIGNTDSITFTVNAYDTDGRVLNINPQWEPVPEALGTLTSISDSKAKFKPAPGLVGQVMITVKDSLTGITASFNSLNPNPSEQGLFIGQKVTDSTEVTIHDTTGFELYIPPGSVSPDNTCMIYLKREPLPRIKRNTPNFEIHLDSYILSSSGEFSPELINGDIGMHLTLPVPEETRRLTAVMGRWNAEEVAWDTSRAELSPDGSTISDSIYGCSEFAVIGISKPLSIENLEFHPNPFSPYHPSGKNLQIEFLLNSRTTGSPRVLIRIFNMRGDLVRKLIDNQSMSKGPHCYQNGVFQQGAECGSVEWDGLTDHGLMARNGRYLVQIKVKDSSGEEEKLSTVVLIK